MSERRRSFVVLKLKSKAAVHLMGGWIEGEETDTCEQYDIIQDKWNDKDNKLSKMNYKRSCFSACSIVSKAGNKEYVYVFGGSSKRNIERYDTVKDEWRVIKLPGKEPINNVSNHQDFYS